MPIIGPKPDENKFETLTLLTPACRFINMSWTVVASSFHSMSQNLYKMFQKYLKRVLSQKMIPFVQKYSKYDITKEVTDVTEYCSSISLNTAGPTSRWALWYSQALMVSTSSAWLAHYFSARTLLTACGIPVFHQRFPGAWGLWTLCLKSAMWKSTLAVLNITWYYLKRGTKTAAPNSWKRLLWIASGADKTRTSAVDLFSALQFSSEASVLFHSLAKCPLVNNILLDNAP